jgi:hypothetical protein
MLTALLEQARNLLTEDDCIALQNLVDNMLDVLEAAVAAAHDNLLRDPIPVSQRQGSGQTGRPRIEIDVNWLAYANQGLTLIDIGKEVGCSSRTVRRRLLEHNLAKPAPPVIQTVAQPDGTLVKEWHPTGPTQFDFRDEPELLDDLVLPILRRYNNYSDGLVKGALRTQGHPRVARDRIRDSLKRVRGLQARFVNRPITRRVYSVPEVNSLWHHDGNHSKSRYSLP